MLAAGHAAECGARVVLLEKNSGLGRKLAITGKGRCNVTNATDMPGLISAFGSNGKFLYGAFSRFSNHDLIDFLLRRGVPTKVERGNRVFPTSDRALEIVCALESWLHELKVDVRTGQAARQILVERGTNDESRVKSVSVFGGTVPADAVILATGGITYPKTGSTGDGYRIAAELGHTIVQPTPSLSALEVRDPWIAELMGLSLKNVMATLYVGRKKVAKEFGEMLFTHFGVSGPIILTLSKTYARLEAQDDVVLSINLKPAVKREELDERLIRDFSQIRFFKNYLPDLLPRSLIRTFIRLSGIPGDVEVNKITAVQRRKLLDLLLDFRLTIKRARATDEAIVTAGGVSIKEIDPRTMESKLVRGLYFCGEVIDIDAVTGGFNLQAAFSTGWIAGESAARTRAADSGDREMMKSE
jgi:hypothetical protein